MLPTRPAEAIATRRSACALCPKDIEPGAPIRHVTPALGWAHAACAEDYFEVYPEHDHSDTLQEPV
jgi:hypothetical protein